MQIILLHLFPIMHWWPLVNRQSLHTLGSRLYFCKNKKTVMEFLNKAHFIKEIDANNFFAEKQGSIYSMLDQDKCAHRFAHIFYECNLRQPTHSDARTQTTGMPA